MTNVEPAGPPVMPRSAAEALRARAAGLARGVSGAVTLSRAGAATLISHLPGTMHATRAGAHGTTSALQSLPDTTLRSLAATSLGLGAGFYLAGAPRLAVAAGVAPALVMGAAIVLRPPAVAVESETTTPVGTLEPAQGAA
jgi:hypothetical protein